MLKDLPENIRGLVSTLLSGLAGILVFYALDKADLFNVKAERRNQRIREIFDLRIQDIREKTATASAATLAIAGDGSYNLTAQISVGAKKYEINRQIDEIENQINVAKSENVRLNSVLSNYVSLSEVEEYATKILGMKKLESYQIEYIDLSEEEGVIYSADGGSFWDIFG